MQVEARRDARGRDRDAPATVEGLLPFGVVERDRAGVRAGRAREPVRIERREAIDAQRRPSHTSAWGRRVLDRVERGIAQKRTFEPLGGGEDAEARPGVDVG